MPTETKEETLQEKISKSSGNDTEKYSAELEKEAEKLLNQAYHPDKNKEVIEEEENEEAEGEKEEEETKEPEANAEAEEKKEEASDKKEETGEIVPDDTDTVESLKEKLLKSEQRVSDNRKAFSASKKELSEERLASKAVIENLNQTVLGLQKKIDEISVTDTAKETKAAHKEIKKDLADLDKQFEVLDKIDPDIAKPIKQIIENLTGEITDVRAELKNRTEADKKTAQEIADEKHYSAIENAHKDWEDIVDSQEFEDYIESLSPRNKRLARQDLNQGSAENIIELFDDYKTAIGKPIQTNNKNNGQDNNDKNLKDIEKMVNPEIRKTKEIRTGPTIKYTREMIQRESAKDPNWFAKNEAAIDVEMAAGRIPPR